MSCPAHPPANATLPCAKVWTNNPMKQVMKRFPGTKWADLAAFHLLDNKLCGDWQGTSKCPDKEAEMYEKYVKEHSQSPSAPEALYRATFRRAALVEIYKTRKIQRSLKSRKPALPLWRNSWCRNIRKAIGLPAARCWLYLLQQGVPTYGNVVQ